MKNAFFPSIYCLLPILYSVAAIPSTNPATIPSTNPATIGGGIPSTPVWCVAKNNVNDSALEGALNWVCAQGGIDCALIQNRGTCYDSADFQDRASYAFNAYFLSHNLTQNSCNFDGAAAITAIDPSFHGCSKLPSSLTVKNGNFAVSSTSGKDTGRGTLPFEISSRDRIISNQKWPLITIYLLIYNVLNIRRML